MTALDVMDTLLGTRNQDLNLIQDI